MPAATMSRQREGLVAGLGAYLVWGFLPVYFVTVSAVAPLEVVAHRIVWAVPFGAAILALRHQWPDVRTALGSAGTMGWLSITTLCIAANWLIYVWAIQDNRIVETSLGYYINPLIHVLAGVVLLGERLHRMQVVAVILAATGVAILTLQSGTVPWVALSLAMTFAVYAVIRKRAAVGAMPGLFIETIILLPFALAWLGWLHATDALGFAAAPGALKFWLAMAGPVTALPLLLFALAAKRLTLTSIGFMQFLAPTIQFLTGLYYGETLTTAHVICFCFIWAAVGVFSFDALQRGRAAVAGVAR